MTRDQALGGIVDDAREAGVPVESWDYDLAMSVLQVWVPGYRLELPVDPMASGAELDGWRALAIEMLVEKWAEGT